MNCVNKLQRVHFLLLNKNAMLAGIPKHHHYCITPTHAGPDDGILVRLLELDPIPSVPT